VTAGLTFIDSQQLPDGRHLRHAIFVRRTNVPLSSTCHVAQLASERLEALLASEVRAELTEAVPLELGMQAVLLGAAHVVRARGESADAFVVIRPHDAHGLAAAAFATEVGAQDRGLSSLEARVIERLSCEVASACTPLCGTVTGIGPVAAERAAHEAVVYFEMRLSSPVRAAIGFALTREPSASVAANLRLEDLGDVRLQTRVILGRAKLALATLVSLIPGAILSLDTNLDAVATLAVGKHVAAHGICGARRGRFALRVTEGAGLGA
jgi:flagellar motor switch/type III secretory pathway protein FliN